MKDLKPRLITAIIGIILMVAIINMGGYVLGAAILILSIIGLNEFFKALENIDYKPIYWAGYLSTFGIFISSIFPQIEFKFILMITVLLLLLEYLLKDNIEIYNLGITLLGVLYIPLSLFHIYLLDGQIFIWLVFIVAFGSDTCAYFVGNLLGKNKLSPNISPNKSIEGSIGGILGSVVLACAFNYFLYDGSMWKFVFIGGFGSIVSQIGDLVASKIKRNANIKDYGNLFPGHGGVMDRFDSVMFSAPLIYYAVKYFL